MTARITTEGGRVRKGFDFSNCKTWEQRQVVKLAGLLESTETVEVYDIAKTGSVYGMIIAADGIGRFPFRIADHPTKTRVAALVKRMRKEGFIYSEAEECA